ncbi:LPXTG cell wall anchor domain-containing protein [Streptomyces sp. NPDC057939]|uniref:LPXTG cell wall anchor domain-containing protein n=1 Tax=Streptomyces sp. NPDC057939 TaxID=3346284 RepID=UPI0036EF34AC
MSARRPLLTALGATTLLAVLWFVPSANATAPGQDAARSSGGPAAANTGTVNGVSTQDATRSGSARSDTTDPAAPDSGTPESTRADAGTPDGISAGDRASMVTLTLADTGSADTTPYVLGGTVCLGLGAGFVAFSVRRSRTQ